MASAIRSAYFWIWSASLTLDDDAAIARSLAIVTSFRVFPHGLYSITFASLPG